MLAPVLGSSLGVTGGGFHAGFGVSSSSASSSSSPSSFSMVSSSCSGSAWNSKGQYLIDEELSTVVIK